ncbi:MAG TPA: hypothetical protein VF735_07565 [Pyrinomonadaceae bacterium]
MKRISMIILACVLLLTAATAFAQTRTRRSTAGRRGTRTASTRNTGTANASSVRPAAGRLAEQIKSLGKFLYLYGPISKELAASEAGAGNNQSSEALQRNRAKLRDVFEGYRVQMDELETMFSSSSELRQYYPRLLGVAAGASRGEELVAAGRYDEAGRSLLEVMNRLTDVLLEMP